MQYADVTPMFRSLGDPTRKRIFEFLCERCCPVAIGETGEVRQLQGATVGEVCCHITGSEKFNSTISFHLKELRLARLIDAENSGKFIVRSGAIDEMTAYLAALPKPGTAPCGPPNNQETNQ